MSENWLINSMSVDDFNFYILTFDTKFKKIRTCLLQIACYMKICIVSLIFGSIIVRYIILMRLDHNLQLV